MKFASQNIKNTSQIVMCEPLIRTLEVSYFLKS